MNGSVLHPAKMTGISPADVSVGFDLKQIFFTNLQLLGFDAAAMEMKYSIPFNKEMFNLPNKKGAEAVLYFLFNRLNPSLCRQEFRDCWPVCDKKTETQFRKVCCMWLQNIQKDEGDARLPRINASVFLSPGGDKFCQLVFYFSNYVLLHVLKTEMGVKQHQLLSFPSLTTQNKELGPAMEKTIHCASIRLRRHHMDQLSVLIAARQRWKDYAEEIVKESRGLTKEIDKLEREMRDEVNKAARGGAARGSPVPPARNDHVFETDISAHAAKRTQRVQQVRELWQTLHDFWGKTAKQREIIDSVIDWSQERHVLDASGITVNIPNLILTDGERELRRRQVENVYEAGELNLLSVLQLGNMALHYYLSSLKDGGLKDMRQCSDHASGQAHTHYTYQMRAAALREKMTQEVPHRKTMVANLRSGFDSEATFQTAGLGLSAPSPPVTFGPSSGSSGTTPEGPVLERTPEPEDTPEAAAAIVDMVTRNVRRNLLNQRDVFSAFGVYPVVKKNANRNNSSVRTAADANTGEANTNNSNVHRNGSNRPAGGGTKTVPGSRIPKGRTDKQAGHTKVTGSQQQGHSKVMGQVQPRVVRHVGRGHAVPAQTTHQRPGKVGVKNSAGGSARQLASTPERAPKNKAMEPGRPPAASESSDYLQETPRRRAHNILADQIVWAVMHGEEEEDTVDCLDPEPFLLQAPVTNEHLSLLDSLQRLQVTPHHKALSSQTPPAAAPIPVRSGDEEGVAASEDGSLQNPETLSEDAFIKHDLIHRSPLEQDIRRMWQDVLSESAKKDERPADEALHHADSDTDGSPNQLAPTGQQSPGSTHSSFARAATPQTAVGRARPGNASSSDSSPSQVSGYVPVAFRQENFGEHSPPCEEEEMSFGQTLVGDGLTFSTSFDEDFPQVLGGSVVEKGAIDWEERTSALYDDDDDDDGVGDDGDVQDLEQKQADTQPRSLGNAADELFGTGSPSNSRLAPFDDPQTLTSDNANRTDVSPYRSSPLISFTPLQASRSQSFNNTVDELFKTGTPTNSRVSPLGRPQTLLSDTANRRIDSNQPVASPLISFTPYKPSRTGNSKTNGSGLSKAVDTPVKNVLENYSEPVSRLAVSGNRKNSDQDLSASASADLKVRDHPVGRLVSNLKASPPKSSLPKKVTFSPESSSHSGSMRIQDDFLGEDDLLNVSPASPLDDSFTPLQHGLCVQGRSPARPPQQQTLKWEVPPASDQAEEDIAERLRRLRKLTAEALKSCQGRISDVGRPGEEQKTEERDQRGEDNGSTSKLAASSPAPVRTAETNRHVAPLQVDQFSIFDEDDSVLLPTSPS